MDGRRPDDSIAAMTAVLDWWREAGVDSTFDDSPHHWLAVPEPPGDTPVSTDPAGFPVIAAPPVRAPAPTPAIGGDRAGWPTELSAFAAWWLAEPSLDHGQVRGRVPPRGAFAAPLMVLVPEPEADDRETLLSGPQGRLLGAMLAAMGLAETEVYVASALPRHTPMADWAAVAAQGLGEVLRHHVALVRPQRLIAFGRHLPPLLASAGLASPLADNAPAQNDAVSAQFRHEQGDIPLLPARDLGALLERPIAKRHFWQHWLEWSAA